MKVAPAELTVYTIGHSRHSPDAFIGLLRRHGIVRVVDVRSHPTSRWAPHFRKHVLAQALDDGGVAYVFLGRALGGRPSGAEYYDAQGRVDYRRRSGAADFRAGIAQLVRLAAGATTVILCAEEDPARCHRRMLVAPALRSQGVNVVHVRGDGSVQPDMDDPAPGGQLGLFP